MGRRSNVSVSTAMILGMSAMCLMDVCVFFDLGQLNGRVHVPGTWCKEDLRDQ